MRMYLSAVIVTCDGRARWPTAPPPFPSFSAAGWGQPALPKNVTALSRNIGEPRQQRLQRGRRSFFIHEDGILAFAVFHEQFVLKPVRLFAVGHNLPGQPKTIGPIDELTELRSGFSRQFIFIHRGAKPYAGEPAATGKGNTHCVEFYTPMFSPATQCGSDSRKAELDETLRFERSKSARNAKKKQRDFTTKSTKNTKFFAAKPIISAYFSTPTVCQASFTAFCCLLSVP